MKSHNSLRLSGQTNYTNSEMSWSSQATSTTSGTRVSSRKRSRCELLRGFLMATLLAVPAVPAAAQQDIEDKALAILEKSRAECHRQNGSTFSGVEIQENLKQLLQARLIIAGDSKNSQLIQVIEKGEMPPPLSPPPIQAHNHNESSITLLTDNDSDSLPTHSRVIDALQKTTATEFRYVSLNSDELTQAQARENYQLAVEAFGALKIDRCMSLLEGILKTKPDHTDAIRLRARCLTLSGRSVEAVDDLKRLSLKLTAKVFTADASLLGVRDPQNTSRMLFSFQPGDELEISDYSAEGKNSGGQTIPKGKYLYVTRVKKEGTEEWLDAKGVIFADAITPTSIDQVARQTQSSQQPFGSGTIRMNSIDRAIPESHYRSPELDVQQMELQRFNSILSNQKTI